MDKVYQQFKAQIIAATWMAPVFGGAILYYGLRKRNEFVAKKANTFSWLAFIGWFVFVFALGALEVDVFGIQVAGMIIGVAGIIFAIVLLGKIRRATSVAKTADVFD